MPMAVLDLYFSILAMDVEFAVLILTNPTSGINRILFFVEMAAATDCAAFFNIPATLGIWYDMM